MHARFGCYVYFMVTAVLTWLNTYKQIKGAEKDMYEVVSCIRTDWSTQRSDINPLVRLWMKTSTTSQAFASYISAWLKTATVRNDHTCNPKSCGKRKGRQTSYKTIQTDFKKSHKFLCVWMQLGKRGLRLLGNRQMIFRIRLTWVQRFTLCQSKRDEIKHITISRVHWMSK